MTLLEFSKTAQELTCKALGELRKLILDVPNNLELSTHYEGVDKLVLWSSEDMQIRLHVYTDLKDHNLADISAPHNHRWNFLTTILSGGYLHTLYRMDEHLVPIMVRHEGVGSSYALHHSQYHSIVEEPNTVSLIVRGPIEKESFQVIVGGIPKDAPLVPQKAMTWPIMRKSLAVCSL
jgi:hypothetical protein